MAYNIDTIKVNGKEYTKDFILSKMEAKSFVYRGSVLLESVWDNVKAFDLFTRVDDVIYCNEIPVGILDNEGYFNYREPIIIC